MPTFTAHASALIYFTRPGKDQPNRIARDSVGVIEGKTGAATDGDRNAGVKIWNIHVGHDGAMWTPPSPYIVVGYDISKAPFDLPDGSATPLYRIRVKRFSGRI